jgi:uncharacterized protein YndB with AHSA1/START domain
MKEIRSEIEIQASPEKVWKILTDLDKYQEWNPFLHHAGGKTELFRVRAFETQLG